MDWQNIAPLGKKGVVTDDGLLGQRARFLDLNYASTDPVKPQLSHEPVYAILCRNESGGTLDPGDLVDWDAGSTYGPGKAVSGQGSATTVPAGIVDPWISGTVANDEFFWLIVDGPAKGKFTTGTTLNEGDLLASGASGRVIKATVGTTSDHFTVGTSLAAVDTGIDDDTLFRIRVHTKFG